MRDVLHDFIAQQQLAMLLMATFAGLALSLAALGIYSVMAYSVTARTREFGIRLALGEDRRHVLLLVLRQGLATTIIGVACGLGVAMLGTKAIASMLVRVSPHDLVTFVFAPAIL